MASRTVKIKFFDNKPEESKNTAALAVSENITTRLTIITGARIKPVILGLFLLFSPQ